MHAHACLTVPQWMRTRKASGADRSIRVGKGQRVNSSLPGTQQSHNKLPRASVWGPRCFLFCCVYPPGLLATRVAMVGHSSRGDVNGQLGSSSGVVDPRTSSLRSVPKGAADSYGSIGEPRLIGRRFCFLLSASPFGERRTVLCSMSLLALFVTGLQFSHSRGYQLVLCPVTLQSAERKTSLPAFPEHRHFLLVCCSSGWAERMKGSSSSVLANRDWLVVRTLGRRIWAFWHP